MCQQLHVVAYNPMRRVRLRNVLIVSNLNTPIYHRTINWSNKCPPSDQTPYTEGTSDHRNPYMFVHRGRVHGIGRIALSSMNSYRPLEYDMPT